MIPKSNNSGFFTENKLYAPLLNDPINSDFKFTDKKKENPYYEIKIPDIKQEMMDEKNAKMEYRLNQIQKKHFSTEGIFQRQSGFIGRKAQRLKCLVISFSSIFFIGCLGSALLIQALAKDDDRILITVGKVLALLSLVTVSCGAAYLGHLKEKYPAENPKNILPTLLPEEKNTLLEAGLMAESETEVPRKTLFKRFLQEKRRLSLLRSPDMVNNFIPEIVNIIAEYDRVFHFPIEEKPAREESGVSVGIFST